DYYCLSYDTECVLF
nr:immunoglobulin light chain junction region [Macaca mulatta]